MVEEAAAGAVDVGLAAVADGLEDLAPVAHEGGHLVEDAAAGEPVAGLAEVVGGGVVAVAARCRVRRRSGRGRRSRW